MGISDDELKAIEARANAATSGPWHALRDGTFCAPEKPAVDTAGIIKLTLKSDWLVENMDIDWKKKSDQKFIAHARTDIPALIADLRAAREALRFYAAKGEAMACGECIEDGGERARRALGEE